MISNGFPRAKKNILVTRRIFLSLGIVTFVLGTAFGAVFFSTRPNTLAATSSSATFYELGFTQQGQCSPAVYVAPWEVVLNSSTTVIEPSGGEIVTNAYGASPTYENYSVIVFAVANGVYSYAVNGLGRNLTGIATVSNSDTTVSVAAVIFCTTTASYSTTK